MEISARDVDTIDRYRPELRQTEETPSPGL